MAPGFPGVFRRAPQRARHAGGDNSRGWGWGGMTALAALAAFDGLAALGSRWKGLGISGLWLGGERKRGFFDRINRI
jgi:hypothetical protein